VILIVDFRSFVETAGISGATHAPSFGYMSGVMDDLESASGIAIRGMKAQATRLRVISENLANAESTAEIPGGDPYRRKTVHFRNDLDEELNTKVVKVDKIKSDSSKLPAKYDPNHPAANAAGYVLISNVNPLIEMMDMREAQRSYEANMNVYKAIDGMEDKLKDLLK
jgi:flagellar basal-body rod protein FlgC